MRLLLQGASTNEVSRAVGVIPKTARNWLKVLGLPPRPRAPRRHPRRERAEALLRDGMSNREIATALGIDIKRVREWQKQLGLSSPRPDRARAERLLRQGKTNAEVARAIGVTAETVNEWRRALGLPRPVHPSRDRAMALLGQGKSPKAVARATGVGLATLIIWRAELRGRAGQREPRQPVHPGRALADAMLQAGCNDKEVCAAAGASHVTVARWRRELGLPPVRPGASAMKEW
jgi:transposase